ncbi:hypothetical protein B9Z34_11520 [Limnohabitans sp. Hippo3]|nr:TolC family protein [Limnohabitans sp. Hippo3]PUE38615.1 hypothetical protein B9Z34_11520 [Limnohabitans sp. Hippo3]
MRAWIPLCLGALVFVTSVHAQSDARAGFLEAVRIMAYAHPATQSAARNLDAAAQDQNAARWQRFPTPSFQSLSPQGGAVGDKTNRLVLEQPLYAGGRIDAGIAAADHRLTAGQHQHLQVAQETAIKLVNTWYDWLRLKDRVGVQQEGVEAHRKLRQQIERRAQEGVSTEIDLALAAARLSQVQSELSQTQSALSATQEQLRQLAGEHLPMLIAAGTALQSQALPQPRTYWLETAQLRDPQLAKLAAELLAADADIRAKQGQLMPTVSVMVDRNFTGLQQGTRTWLQVSVQPGAGLSSVAAIRAAVARKESAAETRRTAELELRQNLAADLASHQAAREQMGVASLLRQSTQDVADSYARQFVAGRKSWLEVLNAVREAMQARLSVMDAQALLGQTAWRLHLRAFGLETSPGAVL